MAQTVKNLPAMQDTRVQSLGWEDPLEKEMAIHSSILAWRIPWTEEPDGLYSPWDCKESDTAEQLTYTLSATRRHWDMAHATRYAPTHTDLHRNTVVTRPTKTF